MVTSLACVCPTAIVTPLHVKRVSIGNVCWVSVVIDSLSLPVQALCMEKSFTLEPHNKVVSRTCTSCTIPASAWPSTVSHSVWWGMDGEYRFILVDLVKWRNALCLFQSMCVYRILFLLWNRDATDFNVFCYICYIYFNHSQYVIACMSTHGCCMMTTRANI